VLPGYAEADVLARVDQYLTASGLTGAPPAVVGYPAPVAVGGYCAAVTTVTVTYPYTHSFVGGIASFFGGNSLAARTGLTATAEMRNELPAAGCAGP
jgi:hypothetical protein